MPSVSRIEEFRQKVGGSPVSRSIPTERNASKPRFDFIDETEDLRCRLNSMELSIAEMNAVVDQIKIATTFVEFKAGVARFETALLDANIRLRDSKTFLDAMRKSNAEFQDTSSDMSSSELSFRTSAVAGHANRLRALYTRIATLQTTFESEISRRSKPQGFQSPDLTTDAPCPAITRGQQHVGNAFLTIAFDEQRLKEPDMKRIEKSLREIREAFLQIASLVDSQGEMIDCIEFSVVNAKNYSHEANIQLIKARRKQRIRSMLWIFCFLFLTAAIAIGIWKIIEAIRNSVPQVQQDASKSTATSWMSTKSIVTLSIVILLTQ